MSKKAYDWGYSDGFNLLDMMGSQLFTQSNGLADYNAGYAYGVADYLDFGDGKRRERALLCAKDSTDTFGAHHGK